MGDSTSVFEIAANPFTANDVWVSTDKGLFHSTSASNGTAFTAVDGVSQAWGLALGAPPAVRTLSLLHQECDFDYTELMNFLYI